MSIFRESFLHPINSEAEFKELIESSFVFLNEDASTQALKKALEELKDKELDQITEEDLEDIIKLLKQVDINSFNISFGVQMIGFVISLIVFVASYIAAENKDIKKGGILLAAGILLQTITSKIPGSAYKSYDKIIKLEAKMNNELKKLKSLGSDANSQAIKDMEKTIDIIKKIKVEYKNSYRKSYKEDTDLMLEFKGNEDKTEAFRIILDEMGDICEYNLEKIRLIDKTIKEVEQIIMTKASYKDLGATLDKMTKIDKDLDKRVDNLAEELGINFNISGEVFAKNLKKFTVKYSEVSMRDKEAMAKKLTTVVDKINNIMEYYNSVEFNKKCKELADFATVNDKTGNRFEKGVGIFIGLLKYLNQEATLTKNDIDSIISALKIAKFRKSIIFKVLNPKFN